MQLSSKENPLEPLTEQYTEVELSEQETIEALRIAREKKFYHLREIEYKKSLAKSLEPAKFSATELYQYFSLQYTIDEANKEIVAQLCLYFSGDTRFKGDLTKGLILFGGVGVGKTSLIKFFMRNQIHSYRVISCREIETEFAQTGDVAIDYFSTNPTIPNNSNPFGHQVIGFCFDDIGTESNSKYYGKEKNVIAEILLNRYDNNLPKQSTHITTNLSVDEIKNVYGSRVTDRIKEMMNIIQFDKDCKSRRK